MEKKFDYAEELGLLRRAVAEPVPQLIVVEFDTLARLKEALEELVALNSARTHIEQKFDFETDTANGLIQIVRAKLQAAPRSPPPLLILKGPDRMELTTGAPASQRFWKQMNLAREAWAALDAQILLCVEPWSYRQVILHADHLLSWAGMKIHLAGSTERPNTVDRTVLSVGLFGDYRLSPEIARERWRELEKGLDGAQERGEGGEGFLNRFYIPMLEAALSAGDLVLARKTRDAACLHDQFPDEDMPRWHELNLALALAGNEPNLANEHAYKLLDLAENSANERVRERALAAVSQQGRLFAETAEFRLAEQLILKTLELTEKRYGSEHSDVASCLSNLAELLQATDRLPEAEPLVRRALAITEKIFGPEHPQSAAALNNIAVLLDKMNRLSEAEPLMRQALALAEKNHGLKHPNVATALNNVANLLQAMDRWTEAEPLLRKALEIDEEIHGPTYPKLAIRLNSLAQLLMATDRLEEAEQLARRALAMEEQSYGLEHPRVAFALNTLASILHNRKRFDEAEAIMRRALSIAENVFEPEHVEIARSLNNLASILRATNQLKEAEPLMRRQLTILLKFTRKAGHPYFHLQTSLDNYVFLLEKMPLTSEKIFGRLAEIGNEAGYTVNGFTQLMEQLFPHRKHRVGNLAVP